MTHSEIISGDAAFGGGPVSIRSEEELRDSIPYLLGFYPQRSLVLLGLDARSHLGLTIRIDAVTRVGELTATLRQVGTVLRRSGCDNVLVVYVDDVHPVPAEGTDVQATAHAAAEQLLNDMMDLEPVIRAVLQSALLGVDFRWPEASELLRGRVQTPPPAGVSAVAEGRMIAGSRAELEALLRPTRGPGRAEVASTVIDLEGVGVDPVTSADAVLGVLHRHASARRAGRRSSALTVSEVAACGLAVTDVTVRDVIASAMARNPDLICDDLWLQVLRLVPERLVAPAATLFGLGSYLRGDGALACCAFDRALEANPRYRLADMMQISLINGIPPQAVRGHLAEIADEVTELLGR